MSLLTKLHEGLVHRRRVKILAARFVHLFPPGTKRVLDVGCGDGLLARELKLLRPELEVEGLDVLARPAAAIPVTVFDGKHLPFERGDFDVVIFADVLHHAEHPLELLRDAARVAGLGLVIKDHLEQGLLARATLSLMDWIGNAGYGVALPYGYWRPDQWEAAFREIGLKPVIRHTALGLYPVPANVLFERSMHFMALLEVVKQAPVNGKY
jgi:SAM-dependent methyltransferase